METLIAHLKQLQANGTNVVAITYVLDTLQGNAHQTSVKVPQRRFQRQDDESIITAGWKAVEAQRKLRVYDAEVR